MKKFLAILALSTLAFSACGAPAELVTYEGGNSDELNFSYTVLYPEDHEVKAAVNGGETISFEKKGELQFQLATKNIDRMELNPYYLDTEPTSNMIIEEIRAHIYQFEDGICMDSGECSPPAVIVRTIKGVEEPFQQFVFAFYGSAELSEQQVEILESLSTTQKDSSEEESSEESEE